MVVYDNEWVFSDNENPVDPADGVTVDLGTGTSISANVHQRATLDAANVGTGDLGVASFGGPGVCRIQITDAAASGGSATIDMQLVSSAAAALTSATVHVSTGANAFDGGLFDLNDVIYLVPPPNDLWLEYVGLNIVIGTAALTALKFDAAWVPCVDVRRTYTTGMTFHA